MFGCMLWVTQWPQAEGIWYLLLRETATPISEPNLMALRIVSTGSNCTRRGASDYGRKNDTY